MRVASLMFARLTFAALVACLACSPVQAQLEGPSGTKGIAVSGVGVVKCRPDLVKIGVRVHSKAELTDDVLVKYHDSRKRLLEAVEGLKLKNTRLIEQNVSISAGGGGANYQMMMMNGMGAPNETSQPTELSATMQIEISDLKESKPDELLKTVGKVLDTAKDAGAVLGPSAAEMNMAWRYGTMPNATTVQFVLRDLQPGREQAYALAVGDARKRATLLAKLYDVKLGRVIAVQEVHVAGDRAESQQMPWWYGGAQNENREINEITTDSFAEIPVTVRLTVRFDIAEPDEKTAAVAK